MTQATVELDFFGMERENSSKPLFQKVLHRRRSFREIQGAISKINPEIIKSVIVGSGNQFDSVSVPSAPAEDRRSESPVLGAYADNSPRSTTENDSETAPMTIFYNGQVMVFNVPKNKAESILRIAGEACPRRIESTASKSGGIVLSSYQQQLQLQILQTCNEDLPLARTKSLQRFFAKRKERISCAGPYGLKAKRLI